MGINCLGKYICNILTIFIHLFYWDIYYRKFRTVPSAQTQTRPPRPRPFLPPGPGGGRSQSPRASQRKAEALQRDRGRAASPDGLFCLLGFAYSSL